jgi:hypothetical protein
MKPCFFCRLGMSFIAPFSFACRCGHAHVWEQTGSYYENDGDGGWAEHHSRCSVCQVERVTVS